jgi:hypothetical protein
VQPELVALLAGMPGVARVIAHGDRLPSFDLHCPLMSLPRAFGTGETTAPPDLPCIAAAPEAAARWADRIPAGRPCIGLVWAGRPTHHNDLNRSLPLASLAPLLRRDDLHFVSLQRDLRDGDAAILRGLPSVVDAGPDLRDLTDTAALISRLDAVIAVDTAVAHLAGVLGKPLLLLLPYAADFRWLRGRDDSAWYPSARLIRQDKFGDWSGALARLAAHLGRFAEGSTALP